MQRYCKKPFEAPGEIGCYSFGSVTMLYYDDVSQLASCNFTACGVWSKYEIRTDPGLTYYICKRCLQQDGLLW